MWKKFVSLLLCMGFAFATFCTSAVAVAPGLTIYASGATSEAEAQRRLNEIRAVLPGESSSNHATFTVNGVACTHGSWNTCTNCNFKNVMSQRLGITPLRSGAAYTCYGFACFVYEYIFREAYYESDTTTVFQGSVQSEPQIVQAIAQVAKPGDVIHLYNSNGTNTHTAIYAGTSNGETIVYEANFSTWNIGAIHYGKIYWSLNDFRSVKIQRNPTYNQSVGDTEPPKISNVQFTNINRDGYTITCTVTDNVGVSEVRFPTWILGETDIHWLIGTLNGNQASVRVGIDEFGGREATYITHIYAYDGAGNSSSMQQGEGIYIERTPPEITDVQVYDVTSEGYFVSCKVSDNSGVARVQFPTWTLKDDQDDLLKDWNVNPLVSGVTEDGETYTFYVSTKDHNGESGTYRTHIYAFDVFENYATVGVEGDVQVPELCEHQWDEGVVAQEATCSQAGIRTFTCTLCGTTKNEEIPATGVHEWDEGVLTTVPTCASDGIRTYTCKQCGTTKEETVPSSVPHSWDAGQIVKEPSETETGTKRFTCTVCGATREETIPVITHNWDEGIVTKEPTCVEAGERLYTCLDEGCGATYTEVLPATNVHTWDDGTVTKEPTCDREGNRTYTCQVCGQAREEVIPATGEHQWDEGVVTAEPTCGENGEKTLTCQQCGATKVEQIPATDLHSWNEGTVETPATCEKNGKKVFVCEVCGESRDEVIPATGEHDWQTGEKIEASCGQNGSQTYVCRVCGKTRQEEIAATGNHAWDEGTITREPTETDAGEKKYVCEACGAVRIESIAATGPAVERPEETLEPDREPEMPEVTPQPEAGTEDQPEKENAEYQQSATTAIESQTYQTQQPAAESPNTVPQTGDPFPQGLLTVVLVGSAMALATLIIWRKRG